MHRPDGGDGQGRVSFTVKEVVTMKARDLMHWNPTVVTPDEAASHAAEHMRYEHDACIPVVKDEKGRELVGVITARDLATRCMARCHGMKCTVGDHMTPLPLHTVQLDDDIGTMLHTMQDAGIRRLPVVSSDGILRCRDRIRGHRGLDAHRWWPFAGKMPNGPPPGRFA
jgi:CBS domain-containing protein